MKFKNDDRIFEKTALIATILLTVWRCWNWLFFAHIHQSGYQFDLFRDTMQTWFSPLYGQLSMSRLPVYALLAVGFCGFFWYKRGRELLDKSAAIYSIIGLQLLLSGCFGLTDGAQRWLEYGTHFEQFANGLPYCDGNIATLFANYSKIMATPDLGFHLNHYPPGNLLLLLLGQKIGWLPFAKAANLLLAAATCFPLRRIARALNFDTRTTNYGLLLYATNAGVLIFPGLDFTALLPFFSCWLLASFLETWAAQKLSFSLELGLATAFFTLLSFNIPIIFGFISIFSTISLIYTFINKENTSFFIKKALLTLFINSIFVVLCFYTLFLVTNFNIFTCFTTSIANNAKQLHYHAFDSAARYLLRSSGNLIAYLIGSLGIFTTAFLIFVRKTPKTSNELIWTVSTVLALVLATFSTLFIGETERIWLYFTPLLTLSAAITLTNWQKKYGFSFVSLFLAANLLYALGWELFFVHFR